MVASRFREMRIPVPLLLASLTACAAPAPGVDPEWRAIQAERLQRLHAPRDADRVVAALLAQDPQPANARREHIDQREPVGMRRFHKPLPRWFAHATVGAGNVAVRSNGTQLDDRADAGFLRVGLESGIGAGLHAELWSSDSDLFEGRRINDGVTPAAADASLFGIQLYPHLRLPDVEYGAFSMPVRLGLYGDWQRLDHQDAHVEREWLSLGPRLLLEPTLRLLGDDTSRLELVGRAAGDIGPAWFAEEFRGGDDRDVTTRWSVECGLGLRGHMGRMQAEIGYDLHHTVLGGTDTDLLGDRSSTELQRQQFFFGLGLRF